MTAIPTLDTARLRLRPFTADDHPAFAAYFMDERTARFLGGPIDASDAWRRLSALAGHWVLRGYGPFAVEDRASGRFAGYAGPWCPAGWPEPEIMWGLHPGFRGRGYATEAARAARDWAYRSFGWITAISLIDPANDTSRRVAERLGARPDGDTMLRGQTVGIHRHPAPDHTSNPN